MNEFNVTFELFKKVFNKMTGEPEIEVYFIDNENEYMIIKYDGYISFQRCGIKDGSGEIKFKSLDELYESRTVDGIFLKEDWYKIRDIVINEALSFKDDLDIILERYGK